MGVISRTMGCSPTKADQKGDHHDKHDDVYLQPDLDIEAYHFHHYVRDLISNKDFKTEQGLGVQVFLNTLFMNWPIPDPKVYKCLKRYGSTYETWPQTHTELLDTIDRTEKCLIDTILGDKLRPVSAYLKGAATMKELIHDSEAKPDEITWPDVQHIFREMLKQLKGPDDAILLNWEDVPMLCQKVSLRYRVPKNMIREILEGEWRIYHQKPGTGKGVSVDKSSYGMIIKDVVQVKAAAAGKGQTHPDIMKGGDDFTFCGHARLGERYQVSDGLCRWNTLGNMGVIMTWNENWKNGEVIPMEARLKVNGKFDCNEHLAKGEVKKGCREDNFPLDAHERLKLKYYHGDKDAAFEDVIPFPDLCKGKWTDSCDYDSHMQAMMREIFMAWPTVDSADDYWSVHGDKKAKPVDRKGKSIKTWALTEAAFIALLEGMGGDCCSVAKALAAEITEHTEGTCAQIVWPDMQEAFKRADHGCGDIDSHHMAHHKVRLTLKIPEPIIKEVMEGEWRMYCKGDGVTNHKPAFSYGMYITDVTEVAAGAAGKGQVPLPAHAKKFSFQGRSRVEGKWTVQNATAIWNEEHTGRVRLNYTEFWPGAKGIQPTEDKLLAHLKVNMKFECESTQGFIQKARKECTLPASAAERYKNKYYIGDKDAADEMDPNDRCHFGDWIAEHGHAGAQEFLTHLFFAWPTISGGRSSEELKKYGHSIKTWPLSMVEAKAAIMSGDKYEEKVAVGVIAAMHDKNHVDVCAEEKLCWSDFQVLFNEDLGADAKHVFMLEKAGDKFLTNLTLKIPEEKIDECLKGEYRMYCKNIEQNNSFSYGLIIDTVTETGCEPNGCGTEKKSFTFTGRPRLEGKYVLENGTATWNEQGSGRFNLKYDEHWPDGMVDKLQARLKCNGKFACDSTAGFVQKARKESTLPVSAKQRMESKYYIGDQDAASD